MNEKKPKKPKPIYVNLTYTKYPLIKKCIDEMGWKITESETKNMLFWVDNEGSVDFAHKMARYQFYNHFPGMWAIAHKVELAKNLGKMNKLLPDLYNFHPLTFILPYGLQSLKKQMLSIPKKSQRTFIVKPDMGAQGKGIFLIQEPDQLDEYLESAVAQKYIDPYLIDGLKFDFRIYVLVTSVDPLRIYINEDGLTRFCTEQYSPPCGNNIDKQFSHLTNYSLNKNNPNFVIDAESGGGYKRSLQSVLKYMEDSGNDSKKLKKNIDDIIRLTLISIQPHLSSFYHSSCHVSDGKSRFFEILGFDILIDKDLKPWLIEVNTMPSLTTGSILDHTIKKNVVLDTLKILNITPGFKRKCKSRFLEFSSAGKAPTEKLFSPEAETEISKSTSWRQIYPILNPESSPETIENCIKAIEQSSNPNYSENSTSKIRRMNSQKSTIAPKQIEVKKTICKPVPAIQLTNPVRQYKTPRSVVLADDARNRKMSALDKREITKNYSSFVAQYIDTPKNIIIEKEEKERLKHLRSRISASSMLKMLPSISNLLDGITLKKPDNHTVQTTKEVINLGIAITINRKVLSN